MKVKLSEIIDAIEMTDQQSKYFLDKKTGEILCTYEGMMRDEEEEIDQKLDRHGFYRLPDSFDIRNYDIMESFAEEQSGKAADTLMRALQGKGAFRRFKDAVYDLDLDRQWFAFQNEAYRRKAIRWCEENDIKYVE